MKTADVIRAWGRILKGERPSLSIEITRECPLRCPGCYAYGDGHLGGGASLRSLSRSKGPGTDRRRAGPGRSSEALASVHRRRRPAGPVSRTGGDGSAVVGSRNSRPNRHQRLSAAVLPLGRSCRSSPWWCPIDGLQPEHDIRRAPATYDRILKNIAGQNVIIHCTITGQMMKRPGYLREFLEFWTPRRDIRKVWFSMFTPQTGEQAPEILSPEERRRAIADLMSLRKDFAKLDMSEALIAKFASPPKNPRDCIFAQTTETISADLKTRIGPCQFGGNPDCSSCGCMASMGLAAIAGHKAGGTVIGGSHFPRFGGDRQALRESSDPILRR